MTLSSLVVSRDWQEISVLECILGGLHIAVDVESEPERARTKLAKSKVDAVIVDCDLSGTAGFLSGLQDGTMQNSVPMVILSGSKKRKRRESERATFVFEKPISVEQAVQTLSAARNMIMEGRLRYHRQTLDLRVSLTCGSKKRLQAHLMNLSQGGVGIRVRQALPTGRPVRVSFALPGSKRSMRVEGEVAWMDQLGNAGIRFVDSDHRTKRDLQLWLERQYFSQQKAAAKIL
jgi:uncharacterized protein (TIGR02266 family)